MPAGAATLRTAIALQVVVGRAVQPAATPAAGVQLQALRPPAPALRHTCAFPWPCCCSVESLLWELHEGGDPARVHAWVAALAGALDGPALQEERRLLFTLGPAFLKSGRQRAVQVRWWLIGERLVQAGLLAREIACAWGRLCMGALAHGIPDQLAA